MSKFCTSCGKELNDAVTFCTECGARIVSAAQVQTVAQAAEPVQAQSAVPVQNYSQTYSQTAKAEEKKPEKKGISKGLRLGLSWPLAILAFVFLMTFFSLFGLYNVAKKNIIAEALSSIDIHEMQIGGLSEMFNSDSVTEESTVAEALTAFVVDQMEVNVSSDQVSALLEDETFQDSVNNIYDDLLTAANSGEIDAASLSDDIVSMFEDNTDLFNELTGANITTQDITNLRNELNNALGIVDYTYVGNSSANAAMSGEEGTNDTASSDVNDTASADTNTATSDDVALPAEEAEVEEPENQNTLIENGSINVEGLSATISSSIDAVTNATGPNSQFSQATSTYKEIGKKINAVRVYGFAVAAFLCLAGIIVLNIRKLGTGFRFDAIVLMIVGALQALGALILGSIPKLIDYIVGLICQENPFLEPFRDLINTVATKMLSSAAHVVMITAAICGGVGVVMLIASIVLTVMDKKKAVN